jgi:hypothetical protein
MEAASQAERVGLSELGVRHGVGRRRITSPPTSWAAVHMHGGGRLPRAARAAGGCTHSGCPDRLPPAP